MQAVEPSTKEAGSDEEGPWCALPNLARPHEGVQVASDPDQAEREKHHVGQECDHDHDAYLQKEGSNRSRVRITHVTKYHGFQFAADSIWKKCLDSIVFPCRELKPFGYSCVQLHTVAKDRTGVFQVILKILEGNLIQILRILEGNLILSDRF